MENIKSTLGEKSEVVVWTANMDLLKEENFEERKLSGQDIWVQLESC